MITQWLVVYFSPRETREFSAIDFGAFWENSVCNDSRGPSCRNERKSLMDCDLMRLETSTK